MIKRYTYVAMLRHPETKEIQYGTISLNFDGFMSAVELFKELNDSEVIKKDLSEGYALLGFNILDCVDLVDD